MTEFPCGGMCQTFLDFKPSAEPPWRENLQNKDSIPSIEEMVKDIVKFQETAETIPYSKKVSRSLLISYLMSVQKEEEIGVQDRGKTEEYMNDVEPLTLQLTFTREGQETELESPPVTNDPEITISLPESLENELDMEYEACSTLQYLEKSITETKNLCLAYRFLKAEIQKSQDGKNDESCLGLIDLQACIVELHRIAMCGNLQEPGKFSTNDRVASFKGERHQYPKFGSQQISEHTLQVLVDKYNAMIEEIRTKNLSKNDKLLLSFKLSSWFLCGFLTLHPFGDGNGRVARLLASYSLLTMSPFMTPIYNVFSSSSQSDYVEALVKAREELQIPPEINSIEDGSKVAMLVMQQKPADLCAMLIEANWTMWRQYLKQSEIYKLTPKLYEWEKDRTNEIYGRN